MNLKAMREAGIRKHLLRGGYMVPNHLMVHMMRPFGAKKDIAYADVMGFERVSGVARAKEADTVPVNGTGEANTVSVVYRDEPNLALDLLDVLRLTK